MILIVAQPDERHANRAASVFVVQHLAQTKKKNQLLIILRAKLTKTLKNTTKTANMEKAESSDKF